MCPILSIATIIAEKKVNQCRSKTYCISTISVALIITGIALGTLANLVTQLPFVLFYGPLSFIHDDKTRIHWASNRGSNSYHNTMYSGTNFNYSFSRKQYQNVLPDQIQKFVVMTDIHQNNQYTSTMSATTISPSLWRLLKQRQTI
ncbi:Hypothetical_protein [Hexamita inflata]|nr:Hypothetical protein HINF_LOCUS63405 [Hexamita inflata]CAI9975763.1 Hypothetical protein HINF_LOCUS63408 [Hexamita inflata]